MGVFTKERKGVTAEVLVASMKDVGGTGFAGSSPPFRGRERAAVDVDVGPERRSPLRMLMLERKVDFTEDTAMRHTHFSDWTLTSYRMTEDKREILDCAGVDARLRGGQQPHVQASSRVITAGTPYRGSTL